MSMGVHVYFFKLVFSFSSNKYPIVELVNHMVVLFLISEEPPQCLQQFTFPKTMYKGSVFSTSLSAFVISRLFDNTHSNGCEVISRSGFDSYFPEVGYIEHGFMYLLPICMFGKMSIQIFFPFLNWIACAFTVELYESFTQFRS